MKKPPKVYFRLYNTADPEERVENAILWKLLRDLYCDDIQPLEPDAKAPFDHVPIFGHVNPITTRVIKNSSRFKYWEDKGFRQSLNRDFSVCTFDGAIVEVMRLHAKGKDAFIKATASKKLVMRVPKGKDLITALGSLAYDYCDLKEPCLMVQEYVSLSSEYRFFMVNNKIVTMSQADPRNTPLDRLKGHDTFIPRVVTEEAYDLAATTLYQDAVIDVGLVTDGNTQYPEVIELNPMIPGRIGLYNCNAITLSKEIYLTRLEDRIYRYQDGALDRNTL